MKEGGVVKGEGCTFLFHSFSWKERDWNNTAAVLHLLFHPTTSWLAGQEVGWWTWCAVASISACSLTSDAQSSNGSSNLSRWRKLVYCLKTSLGCPLQGMVPLCSSTCTILAKRSPKDKVNEGTVPDSNCRPFNSQVFLLGYLRSL